MNCVKDTLINKSVSIPLQWMFYKYCIIETVIIFDIFIVKDDIPSSYIPVVQYSILLRAMKEKAADNRWHILSRFIDDLLLEIIEYLIMLYNIPIKK